jgi:hypothetical protein
MFLLDMDQDKQKRLKDYLASLKLQYKNFDYDDMVLKDSSPSPLNYVKTNKETKNTHNGQMKILLSDEMSIMLRILHICKKSNKERSTFGRLPCFSNSSKSLRYYREKYMTNKKKK